MRRTEKVNPLTTVKNIGLSGLHIKQSKIPINPLKLVGVCIMTNFPFFFKQVFIFGQFHNSLLFDVPYTPPQSPLKKLIKKREELEEEPPEKEELDWWSRYYASLEELERKVSQTEMMDGKNRLFNSSGSLLLRDHSSTI